MAKSGIYYLYDSTGKEHHYRESYCITAICKVHGVARDYGHYLFHQVYDDSTILDAIKRFQKGERWNVHKG